MPPSTTRQREDSARRVWSRRSVQLLAAAAILVVVGPFGGTAGAHASLVSSSPGNDEVVASAPKEVVLTFDDAINVTDDSVQVLDPRGNDVSSGSTRSARGGTEVRQAVDATAQGTYTVSYRTLSDDGHVMDGSFVFHVGQRSGSATTSSGSSFDSLQVFGAIGKWVSLSALLLLGGVITVAVLVDRSPSRRWTDSLVDLKRLMVVGACALVVGTATSLLASSADLAGGGLLDGPSNVAGFVTSSWAGSVAGFRFGLAAVLLVAVSVPGALRRAPWVATSAVLVAVVAPSFGGHAWTATPRWLAILSDAGHVLFAAAWLGALAVVVLTWSGERARVAAFSRIALVAAPLVVLTGIVNTWMQEQSRSGLFDTGHGRLVLAKIAGTASMLALGWIHRRQLADALRWSGGVVRSYRLELGIGVVVVALTAVLVGTPPGRDARSSTASVQIVKQAGDTTVRMQVSPAAAGPNTIHLYYLDRAGSLSRVDAAELEISTSTISPRPIRVIPITANHGVATGVQLTPGRWTFTLTVVTGGVPATASFEVPIE